MARPRRKRAGGDVVDGEETATTAMAQYPANLHKLSAGASPLSVRWAGWSPAAAMRPQAIGPVDATRRKKYGRSQNGKVPRGRP